MKILGEFHYHVYSVLFTAEEDEQQFDIYVNTSLLDNFIECRKTLGGIYYKERETFTNSGAARDKFHGVIEDLLYRTSSSDVHLFMQH